MQLKPKKHTDIFYNEVTDFILQARNSIARNINSTMVYTYFEVGKMIVKKEQYGEKRAKYGKEILKELSIRLT